MRKPQGFLSVGPLRTRGVYVNECQALPLGGSLSFPTHPYLTALQRLTIPPPAGEGHPNLITEAFVIWLCSPPSLPHGTSCSHQTPRFSAWGPQPAQGLFKSQKHRSNAESGCLTQLPLPGLGCSLHVNHYSPSPSSSSKPPACCCLQEAFQGCPGLCGSFVWLRLSCVVTAQGGVCLLNAGGGWERGRGGERQ